MDLKFIRVDPDAPKSPSLGVRNYSTCVAFKNCPKCNTKKPAEEFGKDTTNPTGLKTYCTPCTKIYNKQWRDNNPDWKNYRREHRKENVISIRAMDTRRNEKAKREFITAYRGICICCGENNQAFLSLDHKDGLGKEHRKELTGNKRGGSSSRMYSILKKLGWPKDNYQLLCFNCNIAKHHNNNICPHEAEREKILYAIGA